MISFTLQDKYVLLQAENARLKRQLGKAVDSMYYWKEKALFFQAERDYYKEQPLQEQAGKREEL
jgi:hypothetical protein